MISHMKFANILRDSYFLRSSAWMHGIHVNNLAWKTQPTAAWSYQSHHYSSASLSIDKMMENFLIPHYSESLLAALSTWLKLFLTFHMFLA